MTRPSIRKLYFREPVRWKDPGLLLELEIRNVGAGRIVAYEPGRCLLVDDLGDAYDEVDMGTDKLADRSLGDYRIAAGQSLRELLFFDPPPDRIAYLDLIIPGPMLGRSDSFQLRIPAQMIRR